MARSAAFRKACELLAEEERLGQRQMREVIGRRGVDRAPRGLERAAEGIGLGR